MIARKKLQSSEEHEKKSRDEMQNRSDLCADEARVEPSLKSLDECLKSQKKKKILFDGGKNEKWQSRNVSVVEWEIVKWCMKHLCTLRDCI